MSSGTPSTLEGQNGKETPDMSVSRSTIEGLRSFGAQVVEQLPITDTCKICTNVAFITRPSNKGDMKIGDHFWIRRPSTDGSVRAALAHVNCMSQTVAQLRLTGRLPRRYQGADTDVIGQWELASCGPASQVRDLLNGGVAGGSKCAKNSCSTASGKHIELPGRFWTVQTEGPNGTEWFNWLDDPSEHETMLEMLRKSQIPPSQPPPGRKIASMKRSTQRKTRQEQFPAEYQPRGDKLTIRSSAQASASNSELRRAITEPGTSNAGQTTQAGAVTTSTATVECPVEGSSATQASLSEEGATADIADLDGDADGFVLLELESE